MSTVNRICVAFALVFDLKSIPKIINLWGNQSYNRKSCCQQGFAPLTVTVVHLTFCSFNVAYVLNCGAITNQL